MTWLARRLAQTPLAIDALVSSLVEDYQETGRACHLESAPPSPVSIIGHDISLRRALRNVIDNGLHYGSRVTIDLEWKPIGLISSCAITGRALMPPILAMRCSRFHKR